MARVGHKNFRFIGVNLVFQRIGYRSCNFNSCGTGGFPVEEIKRKKRVPFIRCGKATVNCDIIFTSDLLKMILACPFHLKEVILPCWVKNVHAQMPLVAMVALGLCSTQRTRGQVFLWWRSYPMFNDRGCCRGCRDAVQSYIVTNTFYYFACVSVMASVIYRKNLILE